MKVKDLPDNSDLFNMKIKLTPELQQLYADYSSKGEDEIYLVGPLMGDWFISPHPPDHVKENGEKGREIYPMPLMVEPRDFLECEVL